VKNSLPPTVIIEDVFADGVRIGGQDFNGVSNGKDKSFIITAQYPNERSPVILEPTTEKFEFHYTATCLTAADRAKFRYILEGYDKTWVDADGRRTAYYTNLPHNRTYRFRVVACNNDGVWNEVGTSITFVIQAFWYETWKFYLACILGFIIAGFTLYRWRVHSLRKKAIELEHIVRERTSDLYQANQEIHRQMELLNERAREIECTNTRLYEVNENLQTSNKALDEANRFKTQMLSMVSHDLKNPLTTVLLGSKSLGRQLKGDNDALEMTEMIRDSAETMHNLITEILDQAALEHGQLAINMNEIQLEEICLELIHEYQYRANDKQQRLQGEIMDYCPMTGDENRLRQVFDNLISNAIKYSPSKACIIIRLYKKETHNNTVIRFEVQDEGQGLTHEDQQKLFGFFQRLSSKPTGGESSTGVGLAIVKQIVELHGGRVWCESEPGHGATFIVELPIAKTTTTTDIVDYSQIQLGTIKYKDFNSLAYSEADLVE
jgi:signal transduction histidine kinase